MSEDGSEKGSQDGSQKAPEEEPEPPKFLTPEQIKTGLSQL